MGIINIGGNGTVTVDGTEYKFKYKDGMYIGMGAKEISFASDDASNPAKFYFNSAPAHKTYPTVFIDPAKDILPENKKELDVLKVQITEQSTSTFFRDRLKAVSLKWV